MSRTDKDRPAWVQKFDPAVPTYVDHDHRDGRCVEETLEDARWFSTHRWSSRHFWRSCAKYEVVPAECPHDPKKFVRYSACRIIRDRYRDWVELDSQLVSEGVWWRDRPWWKLPDHEHTQRVKHDDWPCQCDSWPERPTCDRDFTRGYVYASRRYYGSNVPLWFRQHTWYEPERTRERVVLREVAKEYNAGADLDGYDFPSFQHRHRASWHWD